MGASVLVSQPGNALGKSTDQSTSLKLMASLNDVPSRMSAIGLSSLANVKIEAFDIKIVWNGLRARALERMAADETALGIFDLQEFDPESLNSHSNLSAIMKYQFQEQVLTADVPSADVNYLLVANDSMAPNMVVELVDAMIADKMILKTSGIDQQKLDPSISMVDLPLPLHQGVRDYLKNKGIVLQQESTLAEPEYLPGHTFTLYFDRNDSTLGKDDIELVAEACKFAATLDRARFVISGHADTTGPEIYNDWLSARRAANVANAIRNDPRFREFLSVFEFGEKRLAIATDDGIAEPMNRRVEITIISDQASGDEASP